MIVGKVIGGMFGFLFAAPLGHGLLGLIGGIWLGNRFDRAFGQMWGRYSPFGASPAEAQRIFFRETFAVMGHVAKADGVVSRSEIAVANSIMQQLGIRGQRRQEAIAAFKRGKSADFDLYESLQLVRHVCGQNPAMLGIFIDIQYKAATADGQSTKKQQEVLHQIQVQLGLASPNFGFGGFGFNAGGQQHSSSYAGSQRQRRQYTARKPQSMSADAAYQLLDVDKSADQPTVKKAYRRQLGANHPDRLIAKGLPEEMIKVANQKTQKIKEAYTAICQARGWKA